MELDKTKTLWQVLLIHKGKPVHGWFDIDNPEKVLEEAKYMAENIYQGGYLQYLYREDLQPDMEIESCKRIETEEGTALHIKTCNGSELTILEKDLQPTLPEDDPNNLPVFELRRIEKRNNMSMGERLYCVIEDVEDYIMHNNLEQDKELEFILSQLETIKEIYDESNI